jgi:pentalenene synthase
MHMPFPERVSPDLARAERVQLDWAASHALLPTDRSRRRHLQGRFAELAARFNPVATGEDLDLSVDQMSWFFVFDDLFDTGLGRDPQQARDLVCSVQAVLDADRPALPAHSPPIVVAFADLWLRSRAGMSASWTSRAAAHWWDYLEGHVTETHNRVADGDPDHVEQLAIRAETGGVRPILDLAERLGRFELAPAVCKVDWMLEMQQIAAEVVVLENDVVSLEKEQGIGDHNLVLHLQRRDGLDLDGAIGRVQQLVRTRVERFVRLVDGSDAACRRAGLDDAARGDLARYVRDALVTVMRGAHDWQQRSERYRLQYLAPLPAGAGEPLLSAHPRTRRE